MNNTQMGLSDPQITVTGKLKVNARGTEMVLFKIRFLLVEITCIVPIPDEGTDTVPVHLKFHLRHGK